MPSISVDEGDSQPRAFVAHAQMQDLILVALIATHPNPESVLRQFRELIDEFREQIDEFREPIDVFRRTDR